MSNITRHFEGICGTGNPPIMGRHFRPSSFFHPWSKNVEVIRGGDGTVNDEPRQPACRFAGCLPGRRKEDSRCQISASAVEPVRTGLMISTCDESSDRNGT